jgi:hypothetical protein
VVSLDVPAAQDRSIIKPGMEIFTADQHVQFVADDVDGDNGMVLLTE